MFKLSGGQDKQGFPMKQGVLTNGRVFLLMKPGAIRCILSVAACDRSRGCLSQVCGVSLARWPTLGIWNTRSTSFMCS